MALPLPLKSLWGTFGTWFSAFSGPCLYACIAAAALGGWGAGWLTYRLQAARVAQAEAHLSDFRADLQASNAANASLAGALQQQTTTAVNAAIARGVDKLSGQLSQATDKRALDGLTASVNQLHEDVKYACRNLPLPNQYIDSLRLPR